MFCRAYVKKDDGTDHVNDVLNDGELSGAWYVSFILSAFTLIDNPHVTVDSTIKDMEKNGWYERKDSLPGSVVVWEPVKYPEDEDSHKQIGFLIDRGPNENAVSHSFKTRSPKRHLIEPIDEKVAPEGRKITKIFWHPKLDD
jgi:hypothetical protein